MIKAVVAAFALAFSVATGTIAGAQMKIAPVPAPSPFHIALSATTLAGLPRVSISATDEGGHTNSYSGVSLDDLIVRAGAPHGAPVRGKAMLAYVEATASDGYHVLFTLSEIDASYTDHVVLIADMRDGVPFAAGAGPYRLIVPFDKRGGRWMKSVTGIDLQLAPAP